MAKKQTFKQGISQETIDETTGEIIRQTLITERIEGYVDIKLPERHKLNNGNFITLFQKTMYNIAKLAKLTKNEYQLLVYMLGTAGIDNSVCIDLNILSKDLSLDKGNVSRALRGLVQRNIILRKDGYRYGGSPLPFELKLNYDQINYQMAYNGKVKEFKKKITAHPPLSHETPKILQEGKQVDLLELIEEAEKSNQSNCSVPETAENLNVLAKPKTKRNNI